MCDNIRRVFKLSIDYKSVQIIGWLLGWDELLCG